MLIRIPRNADYQWTRLFAHIAIALVVTLTFLRLDNSLESLQYRVFAIFFVSLDIGRGSGADMILGYHLACSSLSADRTAVHYVTNDVQRESFISSTD